MCEVINNSNLAKLKFNQLKGKNFVTDEVMEYMYCKNKDIAFELSKGRSVFGSGILYGVTIIKNDKHLGRPDSDVFESENEARDYIKGYCKKKLKKSKK